jgi:hypothetical protein
VQGRLRVAGDMRDYALEDLWLVRLSPDFGVQILKLDLLAPEVISETIKCALAVFFATFILEGVAFDALADLRRVLLEHAPHGGGLDRRLQDLVEMVSKRRFTPSLSRE